MYVRGHHQRKGNVGNGKCDIKKSNKIKGRPETDTETELLNKAPHMLPSAFDWFNFLVSLVTAG